MIDGYGREIGYLRVSVTDRCDLRCVYCMAEDMAFYPRTEVLSLEELQRLCETFVRRGIRKIRLTGGEPLVRRNIMGLISNLGHMVHAGALSELTLTTNGTQLAKYADQLAASGIRRLNVSLDTLDPQKFAAITRWGRLDVVMDGLSAARAAGLAVKINTVALKGVNEDELDNMVAWCGDQGFDLCLIETMPMGDIARERIDQYLPLSMVRERLNDRWNLIDSDYRTGGPARYVDVAETGRRIGFITPMTHGFCESCNRIRLSCTGTLYTCLGHDGSVDLRQALRGSESDQQVDQVIDQALATKPKGHDFIIERSLRPSVGRHMSVTGG